MAVYQYIFWSPLPSSASNYIYTTDVHTQYHIHKHTHLYHSCRSLERHRHSVQTPCTRRCLSSQGTSMYPRVHGGCWATVASSQNCETISGYYKSYYGTSHLYHGFLRCMGFVPSCSCIYNCPQIQIPYTLKPMVQI